MTLPDPAVPRVLSIAGTDPTGGAGIQADLKSIAANGGYGMAVVTALVAQNTQGVRAVHTPPADFLRQQLDAVSDDVVIDAVKIGMLGDAATIGVVREWLGRVRPPVVVIDPVMVATSGDRLLVAEAEQALRDLLPAADLLTPNVPELAVLAGDPPAETWDELLGQARRVSERYGVAVLAKGGHLDGEVVRDALVDLAASEPVRELVAPRVDTTATHGTGCSLSSAVATWQGSGVLTGSADWLGSIDRSKQWLTESLRHGAALEVGRGHGPVSHLAGLWSRGGLVTDVTADWWEQIAPIRDGTDADPFVAGLAAGTLPREAFTWYLAQDAEYLHAYADVLLRTAELADDPDEAEFWRAGANECREEELRLHERWTGGERVAPASATIAYVEHLRTAAGSGYEEAVAAVLPCYWMYADIGTRLAAAATDAHPYRDWLLAYGNPAFAEAASRARAIAERVATDPSTTAELRERMRQAFVTSARHERRFFAAPLDPTT